MQFEQQVVLVTGASRGLGKAFAEYLGTAGARVAVNSTGTSEAGEQVTAAINAAGGEAQHFAGKVEEGADLVARVVSAFGRLDAIIHNAGFVQDKTLRKMSRAQWDAVLEVHLSSAFSLSQAAWPHFAEAGGGSLVFISSSAALYGNFGQANYAAAKMGLYGLCRTITLEGAQEQIRANCLAPFGATEMNSANMPQAMQDIIPPKLVAPLVAYLAHPDCSESGSLFEASAGSFKKVRWERSRGAYLDTEQPITLQDIADHWATITDFSASEHPDDMRGALRGMWDRSLL